MAHFGIRTRTGDLRLLAGDPQDLERGAFVVFATERGQDCAPAVLVADQAIGMRASHEAVRFLRKASPADLDQLETKWREEATAHATCAGLIADHGLPMRLVDTTFTFDFARLTFYYTADTRVDFRSLLKDLTTAFRRIRIDLRQIGQRDAASLLGGVGACGKELCCSTFLKTYMPITVKMARDQNLPMAPGKQTGMCGKLKCCVAFEHQMYLEVKAELPMIGSQVQTPHGLGTVVHQDPFNAALRVELLGDERLVRVAADRVIPEEA